MKSNQWLKVAVVIIALLACWILLVYAADWPLTQESYYTCPICRARKDVNKCMLIPIRIKINDTEFSRYYHNHADPQHQHTWLGCGVRRKTRTSGISAHGAPGPLRLHHKAALSIITSLPDNKTRKAFFEHLYVSNESLPEAQEISKAIQKLNKAYWEDEHRKDWLFQLRKVGLYPNDASGKY